MRFKAFFEKSRAPTGPRPSRKCRGLQNAAAASGLAGRVAGGGHYQVSEILQPRTLLQSAAESRAQAVGVPVHAFVPVDQ